MLVISGSYLHLYLYCGMSQFFKVLKGLYFSFANMNTNVYNTLKERFNPNKHNMASLIIAMIFNFSC